MSYLSKSGNVGFIPQSMADSCATQYKMAVEGVNGVVTGDVNMYTNDISVDEQTYIPHANEYYHPKLKVDTEELYTFHDSDVIVNEITVPHTEDNFIYSETAEYKKDEEIKEYESDERLSNGDIRVNPNKVLPNGHNEAPTKPIITSNEAISSDELARITNNIETEVVRRNSATDMKLPLLSTKLSNNGGSKTTKNDTKCSINSVNSNPNKNACSSNKSESFLDVFKREQMVKEALDIKVQPPSSPTSFIKEPLKVRKKSNPRKSSTSRPRNRGRGPSVHEALQRISNKKRITYIPNKRWHAPGVDLFSCGPLLDFKYHQYKSLDDSSTDEDEALPNYDIWKGSTEENGAEDRQTRLSMRRASLRRQVALVTMSTKLQPQSDITAGRSLLANVKKQLLRSGRSSRLSSFHLHHVLRSVGMTNMFSSQERRKLRQAGWSGGDGPRMTPCPCIEEGCSQAPLPCGQYCLSHATRAPNQQLYAACAAVFADGAKCNQPLVLLNDQTPLCIEHAWKRDNYDKICREFKPRKPVRKRSLPTNPRRAKRRRRPPVPANNQTLTELNVYSSEELESDEDTTIGGLSDSEFISAPPTQGLEVSEVAQVSADDILSQIPDEAFTEFFNQSANGPEFVESEELTRALEAVLHEPVLDLADHLDLHHKMPVPATVRVEVSPTGPS